ncbi:MAG: ABC transporter permease [Rhodospirillaceae bacterium]
MKYLPLIWAGLWRKPTRTVFTFLSIVLAFVLFGLLTGVDRGFAHLIEISRLDRLMTDPRFGTPLPMSYREQIARIPGVTTVAFNSFMPGFIGDSKNPVGVSMTDGAFFQARSELTATKEQIEELQNTRTGVIITVATARKYGWKKGDKITIQSMLLRTDGAKAWDFDVLAVIDDVDRPGSAQFIIGNYAYFDEARANDRGTTNRYLVRIKDPAQATEVATAIDALFANSPAPTRTNSEKAGVEAGLQSIGDIHFLTNSVGGAVLFMLLFITGNSMMQSVRERIPEFGIMKTLGFTDRGVLLTVLAEAGLSFLFAALIGLSISKFVIGLTKTLNMPTLLLTWSALAAGVALSLVAAVLSAFIPALRVKRLAIVDALAGR